MPILCDVIYEQSLNVKAVYSCKRAQEKILVGRFLFVFWIIEIQGIQFEMLPALLDGCPPDIWPSI